MKPHLGSLFSAKRDPQMADTVPVATLFITCGLQGAGKTTLAKSLEREHHALRLTADEWLHELHPDLTGVALDALRDPIERVQWRIALRMLESGCNVVLDWGMWSRQERDHFRSEAQGLGSHVVLCLLDPPIEDLWQRLSKRNDEPPAGTFHISKAEFEKACMLFERPTAEELSLFDPQ